MDNIQKKLKQKKFHNQVESKQSVQNSFTRGEKGKIIGTRNSERDITEHKLTEEKLKDSEAMFRTFVQNSPDGIILINSLGMVIEWSPGEEQITGIPRSEALGQPLWKIQCQLAPKENRTTAFLQAAKKKIFAGMKEGACLRRILEEQIQRPDGSKRYIQSVVFSVQSSRDILAGAIVRDVTERKQAEKALAKAKDELELKVKERTAELANAKEQLEFYTREIIRAQETERKRVAIELHDDTAQNLSLLTLEIDKILNSQEKLPEDTLMRLKILRDDVNRTQKEVRRFSHELRPGVLDYLGLEATLEGLINDINDKGDIEVDLEIKGKERRLPDEVELSLFRIAQEALNNSLKHSQATRASVNLRFYTKRITLSIYDNGKGFNVDKDSHDAVRRRRLGLIGMRERAELIGGKLKIKSIVGKGSTVSIEVMQ